MFRSKVRPSGALGILARGGVNKGVPGRPPRPGARPDVQGSPGPAQPAQRGREPGGGRQEGGRTKGNRGAKPARKGQARDPLWCRASPVSRRRVFPLVFPTVLILGGGRGNNTTALATASPRRRTMATAPPASTRTRRTGSWEL